MQKHLKTCRTLRESSLVTWRRGTTTPLLITSTKSSRSVFLQRVMLSKRLNTCWRPPNSLMQFLTASKQPNNLRIQLASRRWEEGSYSTMEMKFLPKSSSRWLLNLTLTMRWSRRLSRISSRAMTWRKRHLRFLRKATSRLPLPSSRTALSLTNSTFPTTRPSTWTSHWVSASSRRMRTRWRC